MTGNFTIEAWIKIESLPDSSSGRYGIISKFLAGGNQRSYYAAIWGISAQLNLILSLSSDGSYVSDANNVTQVAWTPSTGVWYHVAFVYIAATPATKFYVDGVQQGATQTPAQSSIFDSTSVLRIGELTTGVHSFDGIIDDVRLWNTVRTVTEIADNKDRELVGNESGLQAYWPFETDLGGEEVVAKKSPTSLLGVF